MIKLPSIVIYFDFSKTFYRNPLERLLFELEHLGVREDLLRWVEAFLIGRSLCVRASDCFFRLPVHSGRQRGSVLGPILFLAYISLVISRIFLSCAAYADSMRL